jgi:HK97 family phage portal protein
MYTLYHPLCGISPIAACGLAAMQGLQIQTNSYRFFSNKSNPGGLLLAPGAISDATAAKLKQYWTDNFTGDHAGAVAVLGDNLKYEALTVNAVDAQLVDQLRWTSEAICSCYHVPGYMVGVGNAPTYNNVEALNQQYYSQCLQVLIETLEALLDDGLGLAGTDLGTEFDLDDLLRMDSATMMTSIKDGVGAGVLMPNEGRAKLNLPPVKGGDTPYMQQQNYSLAALDERDKAGPPPPTPTPGSKPTPAAAAPPMPPADATPPNAMKVFRRSLLARVA